MKTSGRCPKCACARLLVVDEVHQPHYDSSNVVLPMHVTTAEVAASAIGLDDRNPRRAAIGTFEIWVCSACGLTEWYARDATAALERLADMGMGVRIVERRDPGPYR